MKKSRYISAIVILLFLAACGAKAHAATVTIDGPEGFQLMSALESMGVLVTYDNNNGFLMETSDVDCYQPVVPNPKAHCYVLDAVQSSEIFDDGTPSETVFAILKNNGAQYNDGSVGAVKVGLWQMSCYRGAYDQPTCSGQTKGSEGLEGLEASGGAEASENLP